LTVEQETAKETEQVELETEREIEQETVLIES
jgi:hypothetical protein